MSVISLLGVGVQDGVAVELEVIYAYAQLAIFLPSKQHRRTIRGVRHADIVSCQQMVHLLMQLLKPLVIKWVELSARGLSTGVHKVNPVLELLIQRTTVNRIGRCFEHFRVRFRKIFDCLLGQLRKIAMDIALTIPTI